MQDTPGWRSAPRNVYSPDFKLQMVELAQLPGASIAAIAREHGFNHNLLFKWLRLWQREGRVSRPRKTYHKASAPAMLPVQVTQPPLPVEASASGTTTCQIRLRHGELTLHQPTAELISLVLREVMKGDAP